MTKDTTLTKQKVRQFRIDFQNAIKGLEKQYGMTISLGNIRFDSKELRSKMTASTLVQGPKPTMEQFNIGDKVVINHKRGFGRTYTILKKLRVKMLVTDGLSRVRVSPGLLQLAE